MLLSKLYNLALYASSSFINHAPAILLPHMHPVTQLLAIPVTYLYLVVMHISYLASHAYFYNTFQIT
jgi:hypothetical protein